MGWETVNDVLTPLAATDFSSYIAPVLNSGADVLVLNHYGGNMVNSLTNAVQFGLRDKQVNGKNFEIVVPLYSELMAVVQAKTCRVSWFAELELASCTDEGSKAFVKSFGTKYGFPPARLLTPAMYRRCFMQMRLRALVRSTHVPLSKLLKALNSTVWATARRCTVPTITSASRTCWL